MPAETQYKVACEFGYPEKLVKNFLENKRYKNAGELVDELEEYLLKYEEENEDDKPATDEDKIASVTFHLEGADTAVIINSSTTRHRPLSLLEETELLYKKSICLVSRKNRRTVVLLPCGHLAICNPCLASSSTCPRRNCQQHICSGVSTYM